MAIFIINSSYRVDVAADELICLPSDTEVFVFISDEDDEGDVRLRGISQPTTNNANTDMIVILANPSDAGYFKTCEEQIIEANSSKTIYYNNLKTNRTYLFFV